MRQSAPSCPRARPSCKGPRSRTQPVQAGIACGQHVLGMSKLIFFMLQCTCPAVPWTTIEWNQGLCATAARREAHLLAHVCGGVREAPHKAAGQLRAQRCAALLQVHPLHQLAQTPGQCLRQRKPADARPAWADLPVGSGQLNLRNLPGLAVHTCRTADSLQGSSHS